MTTRAILTYESADGRKITLFFRTVNEAKARINFLRKFHGKYYNFKIKIVKPS